MAPMCAFVIQLGGLIELRPWVPILCGEAQVAQLSASEGKTNCKFIFLVPYPQVALGSETQS